MDIVVPFHFPFAGKKVNEKTYIKNLTHPVAWAGSTRPPSRYSHSSSQWVAPSKSWNLDPMGVSDHDKIVMLDPQFSDC